MSKDNNVNCENVNSCYLCRSCDSCYSCECLKYGLFCLNLECKKFVVFNKQVTEDRFIEVKSKYQELLGDWRPYQTNGFELYKQCGNDWTKVDMSKFYAVGWYNSWKSMPKEAISYLQSLPEFDANIFKEITGLDIVTPSLSGKVVKVEFEGMTYEAVIK